MKNVVLLEKEINGKGEVKNYRFLQLSMSETAYIYKKIGKDTSYEVFVRKTAAVCLDFIKKVFSETEFKEVYPKSGSFGIWAWNFRNESDAINKFKTL